jgi:cysteine desulfurase
VNPALPVYLDCAASTPVDPRVAQVMCEVLRAADAHGNAASAHAFGQRAHELIERARGQVAAAVGCAAHEVVFTSGATEADNLAIFGIAQYYAAKGRHLVTARTEHKAVLDACLELRKRGWDVSLLSPDRSGRIAAAQLAAELREDTVLVSLMHVNNETGVRQDITALAAACAQRRIPLHVDAAQSVGKHPLDIAASGAALVSLSAHKAYGPKGVGALVVRAGSGLHLQPQSFGGAQERGLRSGTLATHQIAGMGCAFELAARELAADAARVAPMSRRLAEALQAEGGVLRNGDAAHGVPQILNLSFEGVEGESLLAAIGEAVAVSTGSACTSASAEASYVLRAMGRDERLAEASLRFGLGRFTTEQDIDTAIDCVRQALRRLRGVSAYAVAASAQGGVS